MQDKIKRIIKDIRPQIQLDGGDIEFVEFNPQTKVVKVRLKGRCVGCPMAQFTIKQGVEAIIKKQVPEVKEVIKVD